ncbi:hypothetical protein, partial [Klebsiella pneumoniae]|uniref:hypothetical protein n=1 Tax=Klebsiella pneumoniae TaxID=573 RepID=UPI00259FE868
IIGQLRAQFSKVPGIRAYIQIPPTIRIGGALTKSLYQFTMQDPDTKRLYEWEPKLETRLRQVPGLEDVT